MIEPVPMIIEDSTVLLLIDEGEEQAAVMLEEQETIVMTVEGPQGTGGPSGVGSDKHYVHEQDTASDTWTIDHNLGKHPAIIVVDSSGQQWLVQVQHNSTSQAVVSLSGAMSGKAYCN